TTFEERNAIERFGAARVHVDASLGPRLVTPGTRTARTSGDGKIVWAAMGATIEEVRRIEYDSSECDQGRFLRHELDNGFTAIQWWDRCQGDTRGACNSTVLVEGRHTSEEMIAALREHFPHVIANLEKAGVQLVEVHP